MASAGMRVWDRARLALLCSGLCAGAGLCLAASCTSRDDSGAKAPPSRAESPAPSAEPEPPALSAQATMDTRTIAELDALARECAGGQLRERLAALAPRQLALLTELDEGEAPSIRLLAIWERARSFSAEGELAQASVAPLVAAIEAEFGVAPPSWWVEQLRAARLGPDAGPPHYDVGLGPSGDRRGAWEPGPGGTRVRSGSARLLSGAGGRLGYDLSMGRVGLGPLPEAGSMIEHARARAGTTIYYASFDPGAGGFRFPLRAVSADSSLRWEAEVCGPDRKILGGQGHLTVEILVLEPGVAAEEGGPKMGHGELSGVAVYTTESHGVALEVFEPETGARTLAWSSDLWFSR